VFIHNVREEAIGRLGFSYAEVKALNPDIIYVHCMGFGAGGPYSDLQAYDDVIQAASGVTTLETRVDGDPRPRYVPSTIADKIAGLHAAYATLAAIVHRLRTGAGQKVEVPMFEAFTGFLLEEHLYNGTFIPPTGAICYPRQVDPNRQPYKTADGYISIVPYSEQNVVTLFELLGVPELLQDPRFDNPIARLSNQSQVCMEVAKLTPSHSTAELLTLLNAARIPAMAVRDIADILDDPHLVAVDFFEQREHPTEGKYHAMRPPVRFSAVGDIEVRHAPMVGEHTEELRREFMGANEKI